MNATHKGIPKVIAVIIADHCTGCEACIAVCPVDCIRLIKTDLGVKGVHVWCEVEMPQCIGCALCARVPHRRANPYELKICPWDAIEMVPTEYLPQAVAEIGGPAQYVGENRQRLIDAAQGLADARTAQQKLRPPIPGHAHSAP